MILSSLVTLLAALSDPAPPASDLWRFPHPAVCEHELEATAAYLAYLRAAQAWHPHHDYAFMREIARAENVRWAWQTLTYAHDHERNVRASLKLLREQLGERDFYAGRMPSWKQ